MAVFPMGGLARSVLYATLEVWELSNLLQLQLQALTSS